ncbi:MAG TPA: FixH family protein [Burkholderiales bacterium]
MNPPWYRQLWPWLIISGPAAVLVAGAATIWIAFASADGLVVEDYYKQGLAINKVLAREDAAARLGISADMKIEGESLSIILKGAQPEALFVHLAHATRAGLDQRLRLAREGGGRYAAELPPLAPGRWRIVIEDPRATWRIVKEAS